MKINLKTLAKQFNWKLLLAIILLILIPTIYKTTRIFFIGQIDDIDSYSIASQVQWLNIIYEIITEALIVPCFFVISLLNKKDSQQQNNVITKLSIVIFILFFIFTLVIFFTIKNILDSVNNDPVVVSKSINYIRMEVWSIFFSSIASFFIVIISTLRLKYFFTITLAINTSYLFVNILFDLFFLSSYSFSLNLGFIGAGISSIVSSFIFWLIPFLYLIIKKILCFNLQKTNEAKKLLSIYFKNFLISGTETLIRNLVFSFMIIGMMSKINQQGIYWQANSFIWTWMLMPISIISLFIKETNANTKYSIDPKQDLKIKLFLYYSLTFLIILLWLILIPINESFMKSVLNYNNAKEVEEIIIILLPFYICFALSSVIDAIFIAEGKIGIFLIQTLIVNLTIYPIYFILYQLNIWTPTIKSIALMFGFGLLLDFIVDIVLYFVLIKFNRPFKRFSNFIKSRIFK